MAANPKDPVRDEDVAPDRALASRRRIIEAGLLAALGAPAAAQAAVGDVAADRPFVEHRVVLQLSDREPAKQTLILSVANNLLKEIGPDKIALEVVAFGPGIDLLRADSSERPRVDSLVAQSVRFDICMNTVESVERETGMKFPMNPRANPVPAGVVQILTLVEQGYTLVRP
jgi:intracellular sulfur oxidation DsrE/DsrF family protein